MKKSNLSWIFLFSFFFLLVLVSFHTVTANAATATHVVISEVQAFGTKASDEFVELYNPTANPVNLSSWRLKVESTSGTSSANLVASMSGTIQPHGFFLVASPGYVGSITPDETYSASSSAFTLNSSVILLGANATNTIDKVGMGTAVDNETGDALPPLNSTSIERKAKSTSTAITMAIGGIDELLGNGEDTDNNANDFVTRATPQPQNSNSPIEPVAPTPTPTITLSPTPTSTPSGTPTLTPSPTPTDTLTPTPTDTPTQTPTPTLTATPTPTSTPTQTPTPTDTPTMTPTPTVSLTPTTTPSVTPSQTPTPTATVTPTVTITPSTSPTPTLTITPTMKPTPTPLTPRFQLVCVNKVITVHILFLTITVPFPVCTLERV